MCSSFGGFTGRFKLKIENSKSNISCLSCWVGSAGAKINELIAKHVLVHTFIHVHVLCNITLVMVHFSDT